MVVVFEDPRQAIRGLAGQHILIQLVLKLGFVVRLDHTLNGTSNGLCEYLFHVHVGTSLNLSFEDIERAVVAVSRQTPEKRK